MCNLLSVECPIVSFTLITLCFVVTGPGVAGYLTAGTTAHATSTMPDITPPIDPNE